MDPTRRPTRTRFWPIGLGFAGRPIPAGNTISEKTTISVLWHASGSIVPTACPWFWLLGVWLDDQQLMPGDAPAPLELAGIVRIPPFTATPGQILRVHAENRGELPGQLRITFPGMAVQ